MTLHHRIAFRFTVRVAVAFLALLFSEAAFGADITINIHDLKGNVFTPTQLNTTTGMSRSATEWQSIFQVRVIPRNRGNLPRSRTSIQFGDSSPNTPTGIAQIHIRLNDGVDFSVDDKITSIYISTVDGSLDAVRLEGIAIKDQDIDVTMPKSRSLPECGVPTSLRRYNSCPAKAILKARCRCSSRRW